MSWLDVPATRREEQVERRLQRQERILLKVSGEMLAGGSGLGIDDSVLGRLASEIRLVTEQGVELGIVVGGGNIFRGVAGAARGMERSTADHIGMMATVINALSLQSALEREGLPAFVQSALEVNGVVDGYNRWKADRLVSQGHVALFAAGTGNPYFSTDTAAALRAAELGAGLLLKGTNVEGVFDRDPAEHEDAVFLPDLSYMDVIRKRLAVMDITAITLCMENNIPLVVFNLELPGNLLKVIMGQEIGTYVR